MNGKEGKILTQVAQDIKWMKEKQIDHDRLIGKVFDKIEKIDEQFEKGSGKIAENRQGIAVNSSNIATHKKLIYALFGVLGTITVTLIINMII